MSPVLLRWSVGVDPYRREAVLWTTKQFKPTVLLCCQKVGRNLWLLLVSTDGCCTRVMVAGGTKRNMRAQLRLSGFHWAVYCVSNLYPVKHDQSICSRYRNCRVPHRMQEITANDLLVNVPRIHDWEPLASTNSNRTASRIDHPVFIETNEYRDYRDSEILRLLLFITLWAIWKTWNITQ